MLRVQQSALGNKPLVDGSRGFPENKFAVHFADEPKEFADINAGRFRIDYFAVEPVELASLFEVYLQTTCVLSSDQQRPKGNRRIG
jgi:hypothetical protein